MRLAHAHAVGIALAVLLSGCMGAEDATGGPGVAPAVGGLAPGGDAAPAGGPPSGAGRFNLTTPFAVGEPATKEFAGALAPGTFPSPIGICCSFEWVPADDLYTAGDLIQVRITLTWTNEPSNQADLDIAACLPFYCDFEGQEQTLASGAQTETASFVTGRFDWWEGEYLLGVRYADAYVTTGLPFLLTAEVAPLEHGIGGAAFAISVAEGGKIFAELLGPLSDGEISSVTLLFDSAGRFLRYDEWKGATGTVHDLGLEAGDYFIAVYRFRGGTVRLFADRAPGSPDLVPLAFTFERQTIAQVATPGPGEGTAEFAAPAGTLMMFPWFLFSDGPMLQIPAVAGTPAPVLGGQSIVLSSSKGVVWANHNSGLGAVVAGDMYCLWCNGNADGMIENLVDDDGTYQITWSTSGGAVGEIVVFFDRFALPR